MTLGRRHLGGWKEVALLAIALILPGCHPREYPGTRVLVVASDGRDDAPGTADRPLASLEGARTRVAVLRSQEGEALGPVEVVLEPGTYTLSEGIRFGLADSGRPWAPVVYRARRPGTVLLNGGTSLHPEDLEPVTDPLARARFSPSAVDQIRQVSLPSLGWTTPLEQRPYGYWRPLLPAPPELFFGDQPLPLAKWPAQGDLPLGTVVDPGSQPREGDTSGRGGVFCYVEDRPAFWAEPSQAWVQGVFHYGWASDSIPILSLDPDTKQIRLSAPHLYGLANGPLQRYQVANLPEEILEEGQWAMDFRKGLLYCWPPAQGKGLVLSHLESPLISVRGASYLCFEDLDLAYGRNMGIYIDGGQSVVVRGCRIRHMGTVAIQLGRGIATQAPFNFKVSGEPVPECVGALQEHVYSQTAYDGEAGSGHRIESCVLQDLGAGGVILQGGDRRSLSSGCNVVADCDISAFTRREGANRPGIYMLGAGNQVTHNRIHHATHMAVIFQGNDHDISFNEIDHVLTNSEGIGAVYNGRDPSNQGNQIGFNWFHDLQGFGPTANVAVHLDDGACGLRVIGNVFQYSGAPSVGAVFINAGNHNLVANNMFLDCSTPVGVGTWSDELWLDQFLPGSLWEERLLRAVDIRSRPYLERYPWLAGFYGAPQNLTSNQLKNNLAFRCGPFLEGPPGCATIVGLFEAQTDPGFRDLTHGDLELLPDSPVYSRLPGFMPIPFSTIGIRPRPQ